MCNKQNCYPSRKSAKLAMKRFKGKMKRGGPKFTGVHYCGECRCWHLTTADHESRREIRNRLHKLTLKKQWQ